MKYRSLALGLTLIVGISSLHAYVARLNQIGVPQRWFLTNPSPFAPANSVNRSSKAIRYYLQADAFSPENREAELDNVRAAFGQWEAVPQSTIKFEEVGLVEHLVDINTQDTTNVVYWAKSSTLVNGETADISGRLGVAFISGFTDLPVIAESDIVFNGVEQQWFTDYNAKDDKRQHVEGVAVHEVGHLLGLSHSTIGASTMIFDSGGTGVNTGVGLSPDDVAWVSEIYGTDDIRGDLGTLEGQITKDGIPVYGASLVLEDETGAIVTGGISRLQSGMGPDGHYTIGGIPPGTYQLRVLPLQPDSSNDWIVTPIDIPLGSRELVDTSFLPTTNIPITINANQTTEQDIEVEAGDVPFVISGIRGPTTNGFFFTLLRGGVALRPGDENYVVGVYGARIPAEGAALSITGPGITITPSETRADLFPNLVHVFALVNVAEDAPPGLRSLVIRKGLEVAYAPGYLEILPKVEDFNFDGLDDAYQRQHFSPFTQASAAPDADPDEDGFTNTEEAALNSNPNDPNSIPVPAKPTVEPFEVLSVSLTPNGSTVRFVSVPGAEYQLYSRLDLNSGDWTPVGDPITADSEETSVFDNTATEQIEFYQVRSLP